MSNSLVLAGRGEPRDLTLGRTTWKIYRKERFSVVQAWLSLQADVEFIDWPPRTPDVNPIENMWSEVKRTL
jgi:hypothetical protein